MKEEITRANSIYIDLFDKPNFIGSVCEKSIFPDTILFSRAPFLNNEISIIANSEVSCGFLPYSHPSYGLSFKEENNPYTVGFIEALSISNDAYNPSVLGNSARPWETRISLNNNDYIFGTATELLTAEIDDPISISHKLYSEPSTLINLSSWENLACCPSYGLSFKEENNQYAVGFIEALSISADAYNPSFLGNSARSWETRVSLNNNNYIFGTASELMTAQIDDPISISHKLYSEPSTLINLASSESLACCPSYGLSFKEENNPYTVGLGEALSVSTDAYNPSVLGNSARPWETRISLNNNDYIFGTATELLTAEIDDPILCREDSKPALSNSTAINSSSYLTGQIENADFNNLGCLLSSNHYKSNGLITGPIRYDNDVALTLSGFERKLTGVLDKIENYERIDHFGWEFESKGEINIINIFITIQGDINGSHAHIGDKYQTQNVNN